MTEFSKTYVCNHQPKLLACEGVIEHTIVHKFCVFDAREQVNAVSCMLCPEEGLPCV
jgi:hypothetical protein